MARDREQTITFFDLETCGLEFTRPIIQIAAITVDEQLREIAQFEVKIQFDPRDVCRETLSKKHYCPQVWQAEAVVPYRAALQFGNYLRQHTPIEMSSQRQARSYPVARLAAHNAERFDGPFLQTWYESLGLFLPAEYSVMCTKQRAFWLFQEHPTLPRPRSFQLRTLCQYFGVETNADSAYEAMNDVQALVEVYRRLIEIECRMNIVSSVHEIPLPVEVRRPAEDIQRS